MVSQFRAEVISGYQKSHVLCPASVFSTTFRVCELIDEESHSWKTELIE